MHLIFVVESVFWLLKLGSVQYSKNAATHYISVCLGTLCEIFVDSACQRKVVESVRKVPWRKHLHNSGIFLPFLSSGPADNGRYSPEYWREKIIPVNGVRSQSTS
jgi:hypothetical protein